MKNNIGVSIIVPAYNEEGNLTAAVTGLINEFNKITRNYEVIIINDGSTDNTAKIAITLANKFNQIKIINRKINYGFAYSIKEGIKFASKIYLTQYHGDGDASFTYLKQLIGNIKKADLICTYPSNVESRSWVRRFISHCFTALINFIFSQNEKYYNGGFVCKTQLLRNLNLVSQGFTIYAEVKIRLLKKGYTSLEIPFRQVGRKFGKSKAISYDNFINAIKMIIKLMFEYTFKLY
jgi:glycosyltransferase involved in cell wall biosynthesis